MGCAKLTRAAFDAERFASGFCAFALKDDGQPVRPPAAGGVRVE
jgi:hypothetical protein